MTDNNILNKHISQLTSEKNYSEAMQMLLEQQKQSWGKCASGFEALNSVEEKNFVYEGFTIKTQFNPKRIISSSAKVDEASINNRKCFLCAENLPEEQKGILINKYLVLCNPYPIAPEHFTVSSIEHTPQQIKNSFNDLLILSKNLSESFTLFYNGPKCGASAPDHLHFQAVTKYFMPLDTEFNDLKSKFGRVLVQQKGDIICAVDDGLRRFISIESDDEELIKKYFRLLYKALLPYYKNEDEPMMNIHSMYDDKHGWRILIFPRTKHRPSHYYSGDEQILISPASTEMGGVCILPVEKDFDIITKYTITEVFNEVMFSENDFSRLAGEIRKNHISNQM